MRKKRPRKNKQNCTPPIAAKKRPVTPRLDPGKKCCDIFVFNIFDKFQLRRRSPLRAGLVPVVNRIYRYASFADMSYFRKGMKARSGIHARHRARHRKHEAVDEKRHRLMKLNIQAASDNAALELRFHRHFARARRLKLRQRLKFSTRFPSVCTCTHTTHTTTRTAHTHDRAHAHSQLLRRRPLRSLNFSSFQKLFVVVGIVGTVWSPGQYTRQTLLGIGCQNGPSPQGQFVRTSTAFVFLELNRSKLNRAISIVLG